MSACLCVQRVAKARAQPVRLHIDVRLDERPAVCPVQLHHDPALQPAQLVDGGCQGMAGRLAGRRVAVAERYGLRAIRAQQQQATARKLAAEVEEKGGGRIVDPMKVVEEQEQRSLGRDRCQGAEQLVKEYALRQDTLRRGSLR